ncbi:MAG TPA: TolC family protein [Acidobacteriaceae bacterium]|nr:TolC family protein [Acidobacteriaceae bacterium]
MRIETIVVAFALALPPGAAAQSTLPAAPGPRVIHASGSAEPIGPLAQMQSPPAPAQASPPAPAQTPPAASANGPTAQLPELTLAQAEQLAIRNNPRVTVGKLLALAQQQVFREARAAELPSLTAAATAEDAVEASRISAGSLTSSRLLEHAGAGVNLNQLIYDFGHTRNLVLSRKLSAQASNANALATTEEIVLTTDQAFYNALIAQAELDVARQTVETRQTTDNQVGQMTRNKLKSTLDLSFADVDLSQAQLLVLDARNNADASMAALDAVLGLDRTLTYRLEEDPAAPQPPPADVAPLIQTALRQRPDLQALSLDTQSAQKLARAQWDQLLPTISAAGTVGTVPIRSGTYYVANWWGGVGGNVSMPVFNGFLYLSQAREAKYRAQAASENARDLRDSIVRDVRTSWLQAGNNWQRMAVTAQLVRQANLALSLAQTRYKLGLSSIVELSQAQLQQTSAQIQDTSARYQYRLSLSTLNYEMGVAP